MESIERTDGQSGGDEYPLLALTESSRRRRRVLAWVFLGVLAASLTGAALWSTQHPRDVLPALGLAGTAAGFAAAVVCLSATSYCASCIRGLVGYDAGRRRQLERVVLRGKDEPLSAELQALAARFAPLAAISVGWNLAQFSFMYFGLFALYWSRFAGEEERDPFLVGLCVVLVAVAVLCVPALLRQRARAQAYAQRHEVLPVRPEPEPSERGPLEQGPSATGPSEPGT
jgi:hypothetical protein